MSKRHKQHAIVPPKVADLDPEQAAQMARQKRAEACMNAINEILKRYNCTISVSQMWVNGQPGQIAFGVQAQEPQATNGKQESG